MVSSADPAVSRRDFAAGETGRGPFIPTNRASNPRAGQWTNAMSHNMIADYKRFLMTDGEGIRCSLYVSGCPFHCEAATTRRFGISAPATNTTTGSKLRSWPI